MPDALYDSEVGSWTVVEGQGCYRYEVPLPPCPGDSEGEERSIRPRISLNYHHSGGNTVCGKGWSLGGCSVVERVGATMAYDGFIASITYGKHDRMALDGRRLVVRNGPYWSKTAVYFFDDGNDEMECVRPVFGPNSRLDALVWENKHNIKRTYRAVNDVGGKNSTMHQWILVKVEKNDGCVVEYEHEVFDSSRFPDERAYLTTVKYGGIKVLFEYSRRTDRLVEYFGGRKVTTNYRLDGIAVVYSYNDPSEPREEKLVRRKPVTLHYDYSPVSGSSRVTKLQLASDVFLYFTWASPRANLEIKAETRVPRGVKDEFLPFVLNAPGEPKSDVLLLGLTETMNVTVDNEGGTPSEGLYSVEELPLKHLYKAEETHYFCGNFTGESSSTVVYVFKNAENKISFDVISAGHRQGSFVHSLQVDTREAWLGKDHATFYAIDVDGDGRLDLLSMYYQGGNMIIDIYLCSLTSTAGTISKSPIRKSVRIPVEAFRGRFLFGSVTGSSLTDITILARVSGKLMAYTLISDYRDDGTTDYFSKVKGNELSGRNHDFNDDTFLLGDVTTCGNSDLIVVSKSTAVVSVYFGNGVDGYEKTPIEEKLKDCSNVEWAIPFSAYGGSAGFGLLVATESGQPNVRKLLCYNCTQYGKYMLMGSWLMPWSAEQFKSSSKHQTPHFAVSDMTGNGFSSVLLIDDRADDFLNMKTILNVSDIPDVITEVLTSFEKRTNIKYATLNTLNRDGGYTHTPLTFPYLDPVQDALASSSVSTIAEMPSRFGSFIVVREVSVKCSRQVFSPSVNRSTVQYSFAGAKVSTTGRGWQGFQKITQLEVEKGLRTTNIYNQYYPYARTLYKTINETDANWGKGSEKFVRISEKTTSHSFVANTDTRMPRFVLCKTFEEVKNYDLEGKFEYSFAAAYLHDNYGNVVDTMEVKLALPLEPFAKETSLKSKASLHRVAVYYNDVEKWRFGLIKLVKVTTRPDPLLEPTFSPGDINITTYTYNETNGQLLEQTQHSRDGKSDITQRWEYDRVGNIITETVGTMVTHCAYDARGVYNISVDKMCGDEKITTYYGYDPLYGKKIAESTSLGKKIIKKLDIYGRVMDVQEPAKTKATDPTVLIPYFVGDKEQFPDQLITVSKIRYHFDVAYKCIVRREINLQEFPEKSDSPRKWLECRTYLDGFTRTVCRANECCEEGKYSCVCYGYDRFGEENLRTMPLFVFLEKKVAPQYTSAMCDEKERDPMMRVVKEEYPNEGNAKSVTVWEYKTSLVVDKTIGYGTDCAYSERTESTVIEGKLYPLVITRKVSGSVFCLSYREDGKVIGLMNSNGFNASIEYDACNRIMSWSDGDRTKDGKKILYEYSGSLPDKRTKATYADGSSVTYVYDNAGRLQEKGGSDGTRYNYYYYNGTEMVSRVTNSLNGTKRHTKDLEYDINGNVSKKLSTFHTVNSPVYALSYTYDPCHRLVSVGLPDQSKAYYLYEDGVMTKTAWKDKKSPLDDVAVVLHRGSYTAGGLPAHEIKFVNIATVGETSREFFPSGRVSTIKSSGSMGETHMKYKYDDTRRVNQLEFAFGGKGVSPEEYTTVYSYLEKEMTRALRLKGENESCMYTYVGTNMEVRNGEKHWFREGTHCPYAVGNPGDAKRKEITTDALGRVTLIKSKDGDRGFTYNVFNGVTSIVNSSMRDVNIQILYDEEGNRVLETTKGPDYTANVCYVDPMYVDTLTVGSRTPTTQRYLLAPIRGTEVLDTVACVVTQQLGAYQNFAYNFCLSDHKGNVIERSYYSSDGNFTGVQQVQYDPYGAPKIKNGGKFIPGDSDPFFEAKTYNVAGLCYYFKSRWYDPELGVFLTPDTEMPDMVSVYAANPYCFENNDPINHVDPSGHTPKWLTAILSVASVLAIVALTLTLSPAAAASFLGTVVSSVLGAGVTVSASAVGAVAEVFAMTSTVLSIVSGVANIHMEGANAVTVLALLESVFTIAVAVKNFRPFLSVLGRLRNGRMVSSGSQTISRVPSRPTTPPTPESSVGGNSLPGSTWESFLRYDRPGTPLSNSNPLSSPVPSGSMSAYIQEMGATSSISLSL